MGSNPSSTGLLNVSLGNNVPSGGPVYKGMIVELPDSEMNGKYSPGSCHEWVLLSCCKYQYPDSSGAIRVPTPEPLIPHLSATVTVPASPRRLEVLGSGTEGEGPRGTIKPQG